MHRFILLAAGLAAVLAGCNILAFPLYVLTPELRSTQKAEYAGLAGERVAVVVFADYNILYHHPFIRSELGAAIAKELGQNIQDIQFIDPQRVVAYQDQNLYWDTMPVTELGEALGARRVLYVSLGEFSTREPGSIDLARGRITAHVSVWECPPAEDTDGLAWEKHNQSVIWPEHGPIGYVDAGHRRIRQEVVTLFAQQLALNFHDRRVPRFGE